MFNTYSLYYDIGGYMYSMYRTAASELMENHERDQVHTPQILLSHPLLLSFCPCSPLTLLEELTRASSGCVGTPSDTAELEP